MKITGNMTLETASELLLRGEAAISAGNVQFDLSSVTEVDSSGLAVLFGWQRAGTAQGKALQFVGLPANLISLAKVYGVTDLLPIVNL